MTIKLKKGLIMLLSCLFVFNALLLLARPQTASAEESDVNYIKQYYRDIPENFDFAYSDAIYKIHCPDIYEYVDLEEDDDIEDYVSIISFEANAGGQIYFVNGKACSPEGHIPEERDHIRTRAYEENYEIVAYDETNENVYIKFKNLDELDYPEDFVIWNGSAVNAVQYIYTKNIITDIKLTNEDVFFESSISPAFLSDNFYRIKYTLKVREDVAHLIDNISVNLLSGAEAFTLNKTNIVIEDGINENGYIIFDVMARGDIFSTQEKVKLKADITYAGKTLTIESVETDILTLWINLVNSDFAGYDDIASSVKNVIITFVNSYNNAFLSEIKSIEDSFKIYTEEACEIKEAMRVYRINLRQLENYSGMGLVCICWGIYGETTTAIGIDQHYQLFYSSFSEEIEELLRENLEIAIYEDNMYLKLGFELSFYYDGSVALENVSYDKNGKIVPLFVNTVVVANDEYNQALREENESLKQQLAEANKNLANSNATIDEFRERINTLEQMIASLEENISNLETAYNKLESKYNSLNEKYIQVLIEVENLKIEKNKAIEDLLAEVQAHQTTRATLEAQIAEKNGDIESLQAQLDEINVLISEKTETLEKLQSDYDALTVRYDELYLEYQALIEASSGDLQSMASVLNEYKIKVAQLEKQVDELKEQIEEEQNKRDKRKANGCEASLNGFGGTTGGTGTGGNSTFIMTALGLTMFAGVIYAKRTRAKKE